jgi:hypothetical protein
MCNFTYQFTQLLIVSLQDSLQVNAMTVVVGTAKRHIQGKYNLVILTAVTNFIYILRRLAQAGH